MARSSRSLVSFPPTSAGVSRPVTPLFRRTPCTPAPAVVADVDRSGAGDSPGTRRRGAPPRRGFSVDTRPPPRRRAATPIPGRGTRPLARSSRSLPTARRASRPRQKTLDKRQRARPKLRPVDVEEPGETIQIVDRDDARGVVVPDAGDLVRNAVGRRSLKNAAGFSAADSSGRCDTDEKPDRPGEHHESRLLQRRHLGPAVLRSRRSGSEAGGRDHLGAARDESGRGGLGGGPPDCVPQ